MARQTPMLRLTLIGADRGLLTHDFNCLDLRVVEAIELRVDTTGKVWFNVNNKCLFRAGTVRTIEINDERPKGSKRRR